jgi:hypothetical protein
MNSQINELRKGEKANNSSPNKYHLRSKKKEEKFDRPLMVEKPTKQATNITKEKKTLNLPSRANDPISEVREIPKPPSSFSFEHEIQKIRIPIPFLELVKNEDFKSSLSKLLLSKPPQLTTDLVNLQYEKPLVILGPMVEDRDDSSPPFYTSLNIHDKVLHNCLMDSGASHNLMPKTIMKELGLKVVITL